MCPHCKNDDESLMELVTPNHIVEYLCQVCCKTWIPEKKDGNENKGATDTRTSTEALR